MPKPPMVRLCLYGIVLSSCIGGAVRAEDQAEEVRAEGEPEEGDWIPQGLELGGQIELAWERQQNFDLDGSSDDDLNLLGAELQLGLDFDPSEYFDASFQPDRGAGEARNTELFVEEAHLTVTKPDWDLSLQFGRQPFEAVGQWWYDADLDGIRVIFGGRESAIEGSASREALVQKNLLDRTREEAIDNYILHAAYEPDEGVSVGAYAIVSDQRDGDPDRPVFLGIQSFGTMFDRLASGSTPPWSAVRRTTGTYAGGASTSSAPITSMSRSRATSFSATPSVVVIPIPTATTTAPFARPVFRAMRRRLAG